LKPVPGVLKQEIVEWIHPHTSEGYVEKTNRFHGKGIIQEEAPQLETERKVPERVKYVGL
jgi:hypothetical protein